MRSYNSQETTIFFCEKPKVWGQASIHWTNSGSVLLDPTAYMHFTIYLYLGSKTSLSNLNAKCMSVVGSNRSLPELVQ